MQKNISIIIKSFETLKFKFSLFVIAIVISLTNVQLAFANDGVYNFTYAFGSTGADVAYDIAIDSNDNKYIVGYYTGTVDFDPTQNTDNKTAAGSTDFFISKYSSNNEYLWTNSIGSTGQDRAYSIDIDSSNNIYVAGHFELTVDFDPSGSTANITSGGSSDSYTASYSSDGTYRWVKKYSGSNAMAANSVIVNNNNVYTCGQYFGTVDFDPSGSVDNKTSGGHYDSYITSLTSNDGTYNWSKTLSSVGTNETCTAVVTDSANNVYFTGVITDTTDFDPGAGTDLRSTQGSYDSYLTKYTESGTYTWTKTWGGTDIDFSHGLAKDPSDNIYLVGRHRGTSDFDPSAGTLSHISAGSYDIYVSKFSSSGDLTWAKFIGGSAQDEGYAIHYDGNDVYIGGRFSATVDFNPGDNTDNKTAVGVLDNFVTKLTKNGNYGWTRTSGGDTAQNQVRTINKSSKNIIYAVGEFQGTTDFKPGSAVDNKTSAGSTDAFMTSYKNDGISDSTEDAGPNDGDANGDGILDSSQPNVATIENAALGNNKYISLETDNCDTVLAMDQVTESSIGTDTKYSYPVGLTDFELDCGVSGATTNITIYYDQKYDTTNWVIRKTSGQEFSDANNVTISSKTVGENEVTTISYSITDGGEMDADGLENGTILDPIGPGIDSSLINNDTEDAELAPTGTSRYLISILAVALLTISTSLYIASKNNWKLYRFKK